MQVSASDISDQQLFSLRAAVGSNLVDSAAGVMDDAALDNLVATSSSPALNPFW